MDDITMVRQFREAMAEPDPATLRRIRQDVLTALPSGADTTPAGVRNRWSSASWRPGVLGRIGVRAGGRAVRFGLAAVLVGAVATGLVVVEPLVTRDGQPVVGHEAAAAELNQAAEAALRASDPALRDGQFFYIRRAGAALVGFSGGPCGGVSYLSTSVAETWVPHNWTDQWMSRSTYDLDRQYFRPEDKARIEQCDDQRSPGAPEVRKAPAGLFYPEGAHKIDDEPRDADGAIVYHLSPAEIERRLAHGGWQMPTPQFMADLPRNPTRLLDRIYHDSAGHGRSRDQEAFVLVGDILRSGIVPADLRAALFSAAALIPGVRLAADTANLDGRQGVAVTSTEGGNTRVELIFDSSTGEVIGEREVVLRDGYRPGLSRGTTIRYTTVSRQVVGAMGATP
ncbi:CU044_5270 family protein [Dactylosporangium sp. NPDC051485]|uniref:CU044_5270 family protein n=1 Tax=Dactylosporangium sp. NPDC051485 TaxID=3154846 RepID=UPI0034334E59